jgi:hypothetical protein
MTSRAAAADLGVDRLDEEVGAIVVDVRGECAVLLVVQAAHSNEAQTSATKVADRRRMTGPACRRFQPMQPRRPRERAGEDPALTYYGLRRAIGVIGFALPVVLLVAAAIDGHLQDSMSAYYYTHLREYFTGTMCAIGVFLFAYRFGTLAIEAWLTKVGGLAAVGVAFFHIAPAGPTTASVRALSAVHVVCAGVLFVILGVISLFFFPSDESEQEKLRHEDVVYRVLGAVILAAIVLILVLRAALGDTFNRYHLLFWLETVAVVAFSTSFLIKGRFVRGVRQAMRHRRRPLPPTPPPL